LPRKKSKACRLQEEDDDEGREREDEKRGRRRKLLGILWVWIQGGG